MVGSKVHISNRAYNMSDTCACNFIVFFFVIIINSVSLMRRIHIFHSQFFSIWSILIVKFYTKSRLSFSNWFLCGSRYSSKRHLGRILWGRWWASVGVMGNRTGLVTTKCGYCIRVPKISFHGDVAELVIGLIALTQNGYITSGIRNPLFSTSNSNSRWQLQIAEWHS